MLYNLRVQADVVHLVLTLFLFLFTCAEEGGGGELDDAGCNFTCCGYGRAFVGLGGTLGESRRFV